MTASKASTVYFPTLINRLVHLRAAHAPSRRPYWNKQQVGSGAARSPLFILFYFHNLVKQNRPKLSGKRASCLPTTGKNGGGGCLRMRRQEFADGFYAGY
jgi:hypothetical protein